MPGCAAADRQAPSDSAPPSLTSSDALDPWADGVLRLGIVGDSLTVGWTATSEDQSYRAQLNRHADERGRIAVEWVATAGATSGEMATVAGDVLQHAEVVLIETGTNDVARAADLSILRAEYPELLSKVPDDRRLLCLGPWLMPSDAQEFMRAECAAAGGEYLDIADLFELRGPAGDPGFPVPQDDFHPNQAGHDAIAARVVQAIGG